MELKRRDLVKLFNGLVSMEGRAFSVKFSYFLAKNKVALKDEITAIEEVRKASDEFRQYDIERARLAQEYADKNEDGSAKIYDNSFVITAKVDEFQKRLSELKSKYETVIKDHENKMVELEELLNDKVEFQGTKIDFKDIPDTIEPSLLEVFIIADLIIEDQE